MKKQLWIKEWKPRMLVVDLDGTLLRTDVLHEDFWSALGRDWRCPFLSLVALVQGKATLKAYLRSQANVDVASLPYDTKVIEYIKAYRDQGGRTALVTASDQNIADGIAKHLGIFDDVHGSDGRTNLKGSAKARFLCERFGDGHFCYMGDAAADLPVWRVSGRIVTVNAGRSVRKQAETFGKPIEHLATKQKSLLPYIRALRPHQWLKNILIFIPILASHEFDPATLLISLEAFIAVSLIASGVYVLNDLMDLRADRLHPRKCLRPFASGAVPIAHGGLLVLGLLFGGVIVATQLGLAFMAILGGYCVFTTAYSLGLKRKVVLDICILAGLYTIRIVAGGVATGIDISVWLLAFSIFFFLSLAAVKRQAELVDMAECGVLAAAGRGYRMEDLPIISMIALASGYIAVLVMALYVNSTALQALYTFPHALWGICCVLLYWLTRMVLIAHRGFMHDDPVVFAAKDRVSYACFTVILGLALLGALL